MTLASVAQISPGPPADKVPRSEIFRWSFWNHGIQTAAPLSPPELGPWLTVQNWWPTRAPLSPEGTYVRPTIDTTA